MENHTRWSLRLLLATAAWSVCAVLPSHAQTMTDHAIKAFVRPCKKIKDVEAESCPDVAADAVIADKLAANGKAVRLKVAEPTLSFKAKLERSTYVVWCIGRTEKKPDKYREPMFAHMEIEGAGLQERYRMRINYMAGAYQDVAHVYFDVNETSELTVRFSLGHDSRYDLLVDRLELRDVLAGTLKKGYKNASTIFADPPFTKRSAPDLPTFSRAQALQCARDIAASFPPRNAILTSGGMPKEGYYQEFRLSSAPHAEPTAAHWLWHINNRELEKPWKLTGPTLPAKKDEMDLDDLNVGGDVDLLPAARSAPNSGKVKSYGVAPKHNPSINWDKAEPGPQGVYTAKDFLAFRKVPCRWPDDGGGYFSPKGEMGHKFKHNVYFNWVAGAFKSRYVALRQRICDLADAYYTKGDPKIAFRASVLLAHWADRFPSLDNTVQGTCNTIWGSGVFNTFSGRDAGEFGKLDYSGWAGPNNIPVLLAYDKLFPYIKDNQLLAEAIGQTIPWVKTPTDVIELIDVKLVQHFHDVCERGLIRTWSPIPGVVLGNNEAGLSILRRIALQSDFQHLSTIDEFVIRHSRDSTSFIGSMYYAKGPSLGAGMSVAELHEFAQRLKVPDLDLADPTKTTILRQSAQWLIEPCATGIHIPGVGDVSGPQGYPCMVIGSPAQAQRVLLTAWKQKPDPRFAWMLEHVYGMPADASRQTHNAVAASAAKQGRDPRANQPSRVLGGFGVTILEVNGQDPDWRKRSAVVFRTGYGHGHSHSDQLNIEFFSKGLVMVPEFGGRPGYGTPSTTAPESHCLVSIDGHVAAHGKTASLAPLPGSPYTQGWFGHARACVVRSLALIDAGHGDAYLFDVVRASGGKKRTYWFHGNQTEFVDKEKASAASTGDKLTAQEDGDDLLDGLDEPGTGERPAFRWSRSVFSHDLLPRDKGKVGTDAYQAVWPMGRAMEERIWNTIRSRHRFPDGKKPASLYDAKSPRKFTRLILLGSHGRHVRKIKAYSKQVAYRIDCVGVGEEKSVDAVSIFTALIEPFAGKPFITGWRAVDAKADTPVRAVAVTIGKDREDILVDTAKPDAAVQISKPRPMRLQAGFVFVSHDDKGARACALMAGTQVMSDTIGLRLPRAAYDTTIADVDYKKRTILLKDKLPASLLAHTYFALGQDRNLFRIQKAENTDQGTRLYFEKTAELYRAPVAAVYDGNEVVGPMEAEHEFERGAWLTNEAQDKRWPVKQYIRGKFRYMGTGFRGGARCGYPLTWADVPDADGDGKRTLLLGPNSQWQESMRCEVIQVHAPLRAFVFRPLNKPKGYAGSRSYARGPIVNEAGKRLSTSVIPGPMASFILDSKTPAKPEDFTDADKDGKTKFHVYYFGPGDPARLPTYAGALRLPGGTWQITSNSPVTVRLPGPGKVQRQDAKGAWHDVSAKAEGKTLTIQLSERDLDGGTTVLRIVR